MLALTLDDAGRATSCLLRAAICLEELSRGQDSHQWIAKLVREQGEEMVPLFQGSLRRLLRRLSTADVTRDRRDRKDSLVLVAHGRDHHRDIDHRAILAATGRLEDVDSLAAGDLLKNLAKLLAPFLRNEELVVLADDLAGGEFLRHLGIYVYTADALARWVALPEGSLERIERLEQLRPLAAGLRIGVAVVEPIEAGVDTPADAEAAERRLRTLIVSGTLNSDTDESVR